jgi:hypothetical protein
MRPTLWRHKLQFPFVYTGTANRPWRPKIPANRLRQRQRMSRFCILNNVVVKRM